MKALRLSKNATMHSMATLSDSDIRRRARLFVFPVVHMIQRGWIIDTDIDTLESEMVKFFEVSSLDEIPYIEPLTSVST